MAALTQARNGKAEIMIGKIVRDGGQLFAPLTEPLKEGFLLSLLLKAGKFRNTKFLKEGGELAKMALVRVLDARVFIVGQMGSVLRQRMQLKSKGSRISLVKDQQLDHGGELGLRKVTPPVGHGTIRDFQQ